MDLNDVDLSQEFSSPDVNVTILLAEMEAKLRLMQEDLLVIKSPIIRGDAEEKYLRLRLKYFDVMSRDLELLKLFEDDRKALEDDSV